MNGDCRLADFEGEFDFDAGVEGEGGDANGGAGMAGALTEEVDDEFAGAVGDFVLVGEIGGARDENAKADDADEVVEIVVEFWAGDGEGVEDTLFGGGLGGFQ